MKNEHIWRAVLDKILCGDLEEQRVIGILRLINDFCTHSTLLTELEKGVMEIPEATRSDLEGDESLICRSQVLELIKLKKRE